MRPSWWLRTVGLNLLPTFMLNLKPRMGEEVGALGGIRTHDLCLRRAALSPLSYKRQLAWFPTKTAGVLVFAPALLPPLDLVPREGFEPTRPNGHCALNAARLPFRHLGWLEAKTHNQRGTAWWAMEDLNLRPPRCERGALTTELTARFRSGSIIGRPPRQSNPASGRRQEKLTGHSGQSHCGRPDRPADESPRPCVQVLPTMVRHTPHSAFGFPLTRERRGSRGGNAIALTGH